MKNKRARYGIRFYFMSGGSSVEWFVTPDERDSVLKAERAANNAVRKCRIIKPVQRS